MPVFAHHAYVYPSTVYKGIVQAHTDIIAVFDVTADVCIQTKHVANLEQYPYHNADMSSVESPSNSKSNTDQSIAINCTPI